MSVPKDLFKRFKAGELSLGVFDGRVSSFEPEIIKYDVNAATVDVGRLVFKPVHVPAKYLKVEATVGAPKPTSDLQPGVFNYKVEDKRFNSPSWYTVKIEIKEDGGSWVVTATPDNRENELRVQTIEKGSLVPKHLSIKMGPSLPSFVELDFKDNKVTGTARINGQSKLVMADVGGGLFAHAPGAYYVIARLPLAPGYSTTIRIFDWWTQEVELLQLNVLGTESVTVPAGSFDAYKVEVGIGTMWIAKDSRKVVKIIEIWSEKGRTFTFRMELTP